MKGQERKQSKDTTRTNPTEPKQKQKGQKEPTISWPIDERWDKSETDALSLPRRLSQRLQHLIANDADAPSFLPIGTVSACH